MTYVPLDPYADPTYADAYIQANAVAHAEWDLLDAAAKTVLLRMGTVMIDSNPIVGYETDVNQARKFPRGGDADIPEAVKQADCEIALNLSKGINLETLSEEAGRTSESIGSASVSFSEGSAPRDVQAFKRSGGRLNSSAAFRLLAPWLLSPGIIAVRRS